MDSRQEEKTEFAQNRLSQSTLMDRRTDPHFMKSYQELLNVAKGNIAREKLFVPELAYKRHLICTLTNRLMADPFITPHGSIVEREAYQETSAKIQSQQIPSFARPIQSQGVRLLQQRKKALRSAENISQEITNLISQHPHLKKVQYLPRELIIAMAQACKEGDIAKIRQLYEKDYRLLLATHPDSGWGPLQYSIQNESSINVILELLDHQLPGLAFSSLLQPDQEQRMLLENALRCGDINIIQKIMIWMGSELDSFILRSPLPAHRQSVMDALLHTYILQRNVTLAKKILFLGANLTPVIEVEKYKTFTSEQRIVIDELVSLNSGWLNNFPEPLSKVPSSHSVSSSFSLSSASAFFDEASSLQEQKGMRSKSRLFPPASKQSMASQELMQFMNNIFNNTTSVVAKMLMANPNLAFNSVVAHRLQGLRMNPDILTHLTGLQYASVLNHHSLSMVIINMIGYPAAEEQLGAKRVAELVQIATPVVSHPPPRSVSRRV